MNINAISDSLAIGKGWIDRKERFCPSWTNVGCLLSLLCAVSVRSVWNFWKNEQTKRIKVYLVLQNLALSEALYIYIQGTNSALWILRAVIPHK